MALNIASIFRPYTFWHQLRGTDRRTLERQTEYLAQSPVTPLLGTGERQLGEERGEGRLEERVRVWHWWFVVVRICEAFRTMVWMVLNFESMICTSVVQCMLYTLDVFTSTTYTVWPTRLYFCDFACIIASAMVFNAHLFVISRLNEVFRAPLAIELVRW